MGIEYTPLYESLKTNNTCFHRNCGTKYNKQKVEWFTKQRDRAEQPSPSVRRSSVEQRDFTAVFCAISNQTDLPENLHARGSFHATTRSVNAKHKDVTENWKSIALKVGNEALLNHYLLGTLLLMSYITMRNVLNLFETKASKLIRRTTAMTLK